MPTNIERALAKKLEAENELKFIHTGGLLLFAICLANLLLALESPVFAAAIICSAR